MNAQDYRLIAEELHRSDPFSGAHVEKRIGFSLAVEAVARALAKDNPRFDADTFYSAVYGR